MAEEAPILGFDFEERLESTKRMQKTLAAFYKATAEGEKAALNLKSTLELSHSKLGTIVEALNKVHIHSENEISLFARIKRRFRTSDAPARNALREIQNVDLSPLVLPISLFADMDKAMAAYDEMLKVYKKQAAAMKRAKVAHRASLFALHLVRAGVVVGEFAGAVAMAVVCSAPISAIPHIGADKPLTKLIRKNQSQINAYSKEKKTMKQTARVAGDLRADMEIIKVRVRALKAELKLISLGVERFQELKKDKQVLVDQIVKQKASLRVLKDFCDKHIQSTRDAFDSFKLGGAIATIN